MKKIFIFLAAAAVLTALVFSGCNTGADSNSVECFVGTDMIKYNLKGMEDFGFNVTLISANKDVDVEFISFEGENTQGLSVQLRDDTFESIKELNHNGYYIRLLGFACKTADDYVKIDSVNLKIDGTEKQFDFSTPIKHYVSDGDTNSCVYAQNYPLFISTNSYSTTEYHYSYSTDENVTVQSFAFNDFLNVKSVVVSVDDVEIGGADCFPLPLKKDSTLTIDCRLEFKEPDKIGEYNNIYCDSVITYTLESGEQQSLPNNLVSQGVSNDEYAKNAIDYILKNNIE